MKSSKLTVAGLLETANRPLVMGVVNTTPDSFSDGGRYLDGRNALAHARQLIEEGADMLDIGGESTRPGAAPVTLDEERRRVLPVLEALAGCGVPLSVDTQKTLQMCRDGSHGSRAYSLCRDAFG